MISNFARIVRCPGVYPKSLKGFKQINYAGYLLKKNFSSAPPSTDAEANLDNVNNLGAGLYGAPEQIQIKADELKATEHCYVEEGDIGNITPALQPLNESNTSDITEIISSLAPGSIYEEMDKLSREILLYVSHDLGYGMGWAIILVSLGIRFAFIPLIGKTQLNAIKMKLLDPEMKNFQNTMQKYQKMGDFKGVKEARKTFAQLRERYGLSTILPIISLIQVPFMITWFVSLRYVANTPDKFPSIRTDGFLWFQDLSHYDPYFILPIISAVISYYNIQVNKLSTMNATSAVGSPLARYSRYMKFVPFLAMPFAGFFPAALNLYWIASALVQLLISITVKAPAFRRLMGIPEYLPGSILEKLNSAKKPDIVKSMFVANEKPIYTIPKEAINTAADTTQAHAEPAAQAKPTQAAPTGPQKTVEVFANKPKKNKK